jgi:hypothetical protein
MPPSAHLNLPVRTQNKSISTVPDRAPPDINHIDLPSRLSGYGFHHVQGRAGYRCRMLPRLSHSRRRRQAPHLPIVASSTGPHDLSDWPGHVERGAAFLPAPRPSGAESAAGSMFEIRVWEWRILISY